jgi:hypothetical protein
MKSQGIGISDISWVALNKLESSKHQVIYDVPKSDKPSLSPGRRIHKICKGPRLHARSEAAKLVMNDAILWIKTSENSRTLACMPRMKQVKTLANAMGIDIETARGVITKFKLLKYL